MSKREFKEFFASAAQIETVPDAVRDRMAEFCGSMAMKTDESLILEDPVVLAALDRDPISEDAVFDEAVRDTLFRLSFEKGATMATTDQGPGLSYAHYTVALALNEPDHVQRVRITRADVDDPVFGGIVYSVASGIH